MKPDLRPEFDELIQRISQRNMYSGNKIPESIMRQFEIEIRENGGGILVPFWLSVLQRGRGPRRSNRDQGFAKAIYKWMEKHNLFKSQTAKGKMSEAKSVAWYINKFGNKHFRSKTFVDIYDTERKATIEKINKKFSTMISKVTMEVL